MPKLVVAICGRKHHGKDCAALSLVGAGFKHEKFAGPLKQACSLLFGLNEDQVANDHKDVVDSRWNKTPRQLLQFVGTEMFQFKIQELLPDIGRSFWATAMVQRISQSEADKFVISDMRFQHELDALQKMAECKVVAVRVIRESIMDDADTHSSETELDDIRPVIEIRNDGSKHDLHDKIRGILSDIELSE